MIQGYSCMACQAHTCGCVEILGLQVGVSDCAFAWCTFACAMQKCNHASLSLVHGDSKYTTVPQPTVASRSCKFCCSRDAQCGKSSMNHLHIWY